MDLVRVRRLLAQGRAVLRFADHAIIEGRKDALTSEDLEETVFRGEIIEDYGLPLLESGKLRNQVMLPPVP